MIRPLTEADLPAYVALRARMLLDIPLAFGASPDDDFAGSADALREQLKRAPEWMLFGAFDEELAGAAGVIRFHHRKAAHKMHIWGVYVAPERRGRGLGMALMQAIIAHARSVPGVDWLHLGVSLATPAALRLYERAGFTVWGTEPDALRHGGESTDEHRMALRL